VVRDDSSVHAPYVNVLTLKYELCKAVAPEVILTSDGGTVINQSSANGTPNASVEYFVPLSEQLARFTPAAAFSGKPSGAVIPVGAPASDCGDCSCIPAATSAPAGATSAPTAGNTAQPAAASAPSDGGRALYLGFDNEFVGTGISLLFTLLDGDSDSAYPLQIESLYDGKFQVLNAAADETRGLSETGLVTFSLPDPPQSAVLFGSAPLHWLRIRPNPLSDPSQWQPRVRGVYGNAAWALATETFTNETLGTSDGSPGQSVTLARTPVIKDSLDLRVLEPLGDEDIAALKRADSSSVLDWIGNLSGPWVHWIEVPDLVGQGPSGRVFTLDDETGVINFGDGVTGRIPPPRTGSIVALRYQTGGGSSANAVAAWSAVNLITPLKGVQSVVALDDAAGGSDAEDASATLRYAPINLAMRNRAVTLDDFEQLALQFEPSIAQARALSSTSGVKVVVAVRGDNPIPSKATLRELTRALQARSAPMFAQNNFLQSTAPTLVAGRIDLGLQASAIEFGAAIAEAATNRVRALLDPATGGHDGNGWSFGTVPSEIDIAACLDGIENLAGIDSIAVASMDAQGVPTPLGVTLAADQLLHVAADAIRTNVSVSGLAGSP